MSGKLIWGLVPLLALALPLLAQSGKADNPAKNYKSGKALLKQPFRMADEVMQLCRQLTPDEQKKFDENPHFKRYAQVYVNPVGQRVLGAKAPRFPVGTVLVKEKFDNPKGIGTPELLTVMVKREKGYNPACYDWEFLVLDGKAERVLERGKLARCQSCHTEKLYKRTEGVATLSLRMMPLALSGSR